MSLLLKGSPQKVSYGGKLITNPLINFSYILNTPKTRLPLHEALTVTLAKITLGYITCKPPSRHAGSLVVHNSSPNHTVWVSRLCPEGKKLACPTPVCTTYPPVTKRVFPQGAISSRKPGRSMCLLFQPPSPDIFCHRTLNPCCQLQN